MFTLIPQVAIYPPAITLDEPTATLVHPEIPSPILPAPLPLTFTVPDPDAIGATWTQQTGEHGNKCGKFISPCRDHGIPLTMTSGDPTILEGPEQCTISASPILVAGGIMLYLHLQNL